MQFLHSEGFTPISLEDFLEFQQGRRKAPAKAILITFDDGFMSNYLYAFPILKKYGFTGVLYIIGNYMGTDGYMDADQIKEMAAAGWEIGSHSMNHKDLTIIDDPERERYEIVESKEKLETELGVPVKTFAYPFGISNEGVIDYVHFGGYIAGMSLGFTYDQGLSNLYTLQRRDIQGGYDVKKFAAFLPWAGNPIYLPTDTPTPTPTPTRTKIPTYTQYPTSTSPATATP